MGSLILLASSLSIGFKPTKSTFVHHQPMQTDEESEEWSRTKTKFEKEVANFK
jgi:hypothetical protein